MRLNIKIIVSLAVAAICLSLFLWQYQAREIKRTDSIPAPKGDVILKNIKRPEVKINTRLVDKITINLVGPADQLKDIHFQKNEEGFYEISFPESINAVSGTITIPNNLRIIDLDLPPGIRFVADDISIKPAPENNKPAPTPLLGSLSDSKVNETLNPSNPINAGSSSGSSQNNNTPPNHSAPTSPSSSSNGSGNASESPSSNSNNGSSSSTSPSNSSAPNPSSNPPNPNEPSPTPYQPTCGNGILDPLSGEVCDDGNSQSGDGCSPECKLEISESYVCGNAITEPGEECDDGNQINDDLCNNNCQLDLFQKWAGQQCTIDLKQSERNECCQATMADEPHDSCEGEWQFEYFSRLCIWHCPNENCGNKNSAEDQKACCQEQNRGNPTLPCAGEWGYSSEKSLCEFQCTDRIEKTERRVPDEITQTSQYCTNTYTDKNDQNLCCDEFLKHPLSIGPREGFPDCIGKWSVPPGTNQCQFSCVSHEEMVEILKGLRLRKQNIEP